MAASGMKQYTDWIAEQLGWSPDLVFAETEEETTYHGVPFDSPVFLTDHNFAGIHYVGQSDATRGMSDGVGGYYAHYPTYQAGAQGYVDWVEAGPRYANVKTTKDPAQEAILLAQDGWATDPNYARNIIKLINQNTGSNYDVPQGGSATLASVQPIKDNVAGVLQAFDNSMQFSGFDVFHPVGSIMQDGKAYAIRAGLFLAAIILLIFALVSIVGKDNVTKAATMAAMA